MNVEEFFPEGEWAADGEYVISCPFCKDHPTHSHCYINLDKKVFCCHFCGEKGTLKQLLKEYGATGEPEPREGVTEKKKYEPVDFSKFPRVTGCVESNLDMLAFAYLKSRGIGWDEITAYDIRFSDSGRYYGRVLVPIYEGGKLVNFIGRSFMDVIKPKYLFPHTGETLLTQNEAVFGYEEALKGECGAVVITEGVFDAMAVNKIADIRGVAILSSYLSDGQYRKLMRLPRSIAYFVSLDADAHRHAVKIAKKLHNGDRNVAVVLLQQGDPASLSKEELVAALGAAEPFFFETELNIMTPDYKREKLVK